MADLGPVELFGGALGAAFASFVATWATFAKPLQRRIEGAEKAPAEELAKQSQKLESIGEDIKSIRKEVDDVKRKIEKIEDRLAHAIMDDEFAAYTQHTTNAVNALTEKVGRVTGALETWARHGKM